MCSSDLWVKFAGGNGNTAGTISASYNVSSITVGGTGAYTVNLTNALADANYAVEMSAYGNGLICAKGPDAGGYTTTAVPVSTFNTSFAAANAVFVWVAVFR